MNLDDLPTEDRIRLGLASMPNSLWRKLLIVKFADRINALRRTHGRAELTYAQIEDWVAHDCADPTETVTRTEQEAQG